MEPIVVLGARVINGAPGPVLTQRLLTAVRVARPGQLVICSGYLEARAMADFLRANGVENVVEEHHATSTNENLEYSRRLVPEAPRLTVVTSNFHALRTRLWAWHLKIPVRVISAPTPAAQRRRHYLREVLATPHSLARIMVRRALKRLGWGP